MQLVAFSMQTRHMVIIVRLSQTIFSPSLSSFPSSSLSPCLCFGTYDYLRHWSACLAAAFRLRYLFYSSFNKLINLFSSIFCKVISAPLYFGLPSALLWRQNTLSLTRRRLTAREACVKAPPLPAAECPA